MAIEPLRHDEVLEQVLEDTRADALQAFLELQSDGLDVEPD